MGLSEIISLLSGVALFLFGMALMGDGLKKVSGDKLEPVLFNLTGTQFKGLLLGTGVTAVIQSSSATSVMVVGFVNSGMMKVKQAIPVILGAILGTSITGWIVCLSYVGGPGELETLLSTATLTGIVAIIGILLRMFGKSVTKHHIGDIMMGFVVLMSGMSMMSGSVGGLGESAGFQALLTGMSNPIAGIMVGILFSIVLQSASAAVGIVQALSLTGVMSLDIALPLLMGISIGASMPVLLSALGAGTAGKRTAASYLVATFSGVMTCASVLYIADSIFRFEWMGTIMNPFSLAAVNTILRLCMLCVLAPFTDILEAAVEIIIPDKQNVSSHPVLRLEERFIAHPALAIGQSRTIICDMAKETLEGLRDAVMLITKYSDEGYARIEEMENRGDHYEDVLGTYLVKLTGQELTARQGREVSIFLHTLSDYERISDHALNIARNAKEIHEKRIDFSDVAVEEMKVMTSAVLETLRMTVNAFIGSDLDLASQVEPLEEVVDDICDTMKLNHVDRLQKGQCTLEHGFVFNDLITNFERVSDHCSNIAVALIELESGYFDTHEYLGKVRERRSDEFMKAYETYHAKYNI